MCNYTLTAKHGVVCSRRCVPTCVQYPVIFRPTSVTFFVGLWRAPRSFVRNHTATSCTDGTVSIQKIFKIHNNRATHAFEEEARHEPKSTEKTDRCVCAHSVCVCLLSVCMSGRACMMSGWMDGCVSLGTYLSVD